MEIWNFQGVALRNMCNTLQQSATKLIINTLTADKILSVTKSCQQFFFFRGNFLCISGVCMLALAKIAAIVGKQIVRLAAANDNREFMLFLDRFLAKCHIFLNLI
jgi:hypothetical protein